MEDKHKDKWSVDLVEDSLDIELAGLFGLYLDRVHLYDRLAGSKQGLSLHLNKIELLVVLLSIARTEVVRWGVP